MKCLFCEDIYSDEDILEMKEMHDEFYYDKKCFICPDCYDDWNRLDSEDKILALEQGADFNWDQSSLG